MNKLKCLIVEDEVLLAYHLKMSLIRAGYDICAIATCGEQALELVRQESPNVILMDIRLLGEMDGIEVARQIKTFSSAYVIFTTGYSDSKVKECALALNPVGYLIKPVDIRHVCAILQSLCEAG